MPNTTRQLSKAIQEVRSKIPPGSTWRHYKGSIYRISDYVIDTDNGKVRVTYEKIEGPNYNYAESQVSFARPAEEWFTDVEREPSVFVPRFQRVQKIERWHTDDEIDQLVSARVV